MPGTLSTWPVSTTPARMKYLSLWHPDHRVPIVDGKYQNPNTGRIEEAGNIAAYLGPPSVQTTWINIHPITKFHIGGAFNASMNDIFIAVADHVRDRAYVIESINASPYSVTIICSTPKPHHEILLYIQKMQEDFARDTPIASFTPPDVPVSLPPIRTPEHGKQTFWC
ncbi:uncharacterized protein N7459_005924 [Penicillium hispanicum]|uniref:uncharacterized protein n=1 Tax=Penicillium hispanicum TaxID=1080232 RepID=UPI002541AC03|nr:uncharacterized protein N7459_005924 [Penicillium hispanicum]KAJ5579939.1 hypothetical protein N7459_005924 [Penicillium hispanicum]